MIAKYWIFIYIVQNSYLFKFEIFCSWFISRVWWFSNWGIMIVDIFKRTLINNICIINYKKIYIYKLTKYIFIYNKIFVYFVKQRYRLNFIHNDWKIYVYGSDIKYVSVWYRIYYITYTHLNTLGIWKITILSLNNVKKYNIWAILLKNLLSTILCIFVNTILSL